MTMYRLPEWLGGHECTLISNHGNPRATVAVNGTTIELDRAHLTELHPEPESGMWADEDGPDVWVRIDDDDDPRGRWYVTGTSQMFRWDHLAKRKLTRLIKDPAVDAPTELTITEIDGGAVTFKYEGKLDGHHYISVHILDRIFGYIAIDDNAPALAGLILRAHQEARNA